MFKLTVTLALLSVAVPAHAVDLSVKIEPGVAIPLTDPQKSRFDLGGAATLKVLVSLFPYLDVGPSATFLINPASAEGADAGTAWALGGGLRLKTPHRAAGSSRGFLGASLWIDGDLLYVRTDDLNRLGLAAAAGVAFPLDRAGVFWLGPFARYLHIVQGERAGFDNGDSQTLIAGLSLEIGGRTLRDEEPAAVAEEPVAEATPPPPTPAPEPEPEPAPEPAPVVASSPPPASSTPVVKGKTIEIRQKVYFDFDSSTIRGNSNRALDEVAVMLKKNDTLTVRVQVVGHADTVGTEEHNQLLSERRASSVVDYLVGRGVARDRLEAKGQGSEVSAETNETSAGRQQHRRVDFIVISDGSGE